MTPSNRQAAIYEEWRTTDNNILVSAVAGAGKTSTLMQLLEFCEYRTLFLAFNTSIKDEIQHKIEEKGFKHAKAMTMHSMGLSAIRNRYKRVNIDGNKGWKIIKKFEEGEYKNILRKIKWDDRLKLFYSLIDVLDGSRMFLTDDIDTLETYLLSMDKVLYKHKRFKDFVTEIFRLRDESYEGLNIDIDFIDMIYLPVIKDLEIPIKPYYLFIDEAQDLSLYQHKLIDKLISQGDIHKWVAVGDEFQSIYGFAGSDSNSFNMFKEKPNVVELPLDICYRCDRAIVRVANEVYPIMTAFKETEGIVSRSAKISEIKDGSMVICRNYKPLVEVYFQLLFQGKNCFIKGEDILNNILKFLKPYKAMTFTLAEREMSYTMEDLNEDKTDLGRFKLQMFKNNYDTYILLKNNLITDESNVDTLITKIKGLFVQKTNAIVLCTIHKSKGLEADVVYILNESLIPSVFAKSPEQLKQEQNLKYVARTRAKKELYFIEI